MYLLMVIAKQRPNIVSANGTNLTSEITIVWSAVWTYPISLIAKKQNYGWFPPESCHNLTYLE